MFFAGRPGGWKDRKGRKNKKTRTGRGQTGAAAGGTLAGGGEGEGQMGEGSLELVWMAAVGGRCGVWVAGKGWERGGQGLGEGQKCIFTASLVFKKCWNAKSDKKRQFVTTCDRMKPHNATICYFLNLHALCWCLTVRLSASLSLPPPPEHNMHTSRLDYFVLTLTLTQRPHLRQPVQKPHFLQSRPRGFLFSSHAALI